MRENKLIRSRFFEGSVRKIERILVVFRKWLPIEESKFEKILYSLRLSNDKRAQHLASFINYLSSSFGISNLKELYVETSGRRKRYRWKHRDLIVHIRRKYRIVARIKDQR